MHMPGVAVVIWLAVGTLGIKTMLQRLHAGRVPPVAFLTVGLALAVVPIALAQFHVFSYSAWYMLLAVITFFWFCTLVGRMRRATQAVEAAVSIFVALRVGGQQALLALLDSDGSINRMGSGLTDCSDRQMFIGRAEPELFRQLRSKITPGVIHFLGQHLTAPNPIGMPCYLLVGLKYANGRVAESGWHYGSESQGPHPEIVEFVKETLRITEPWFRQQKAVVARQASPTRVPARCG